MKKIVLALIIALVSINAEGSKPKELLAAIVSFSGDCYYERAGKSEKIKLKTIFFKSDRLYTLKGKMDVQVGPSAVLHMSPYTTINLVDLTEADQKSNILIQLESGRGYTKFAKKMNPGSSYTIKSPTMVAAVRGTEFVISDGPQSAEPHEDSDIPNGVFVNHGNVAVSSAGRDDEQILAPGEQITGVDNALVKSVMEDFMKKKMKLFKQLNVMKEEQYKIMEREKNRQIELLEKVKNSVKIDGTNNSIEKMKEQQNKLFNK